MVPAKFELPSASKQLSIVVRHISLLERHCYQMVRDPYQPISDKSSTIRSGFILPSPPKTCSRGISLRLPRCHRLRDSWCSCLLSPLKQNTAATSAIVQIVQTIVAGAHRTATAAVTTRFSTSACLPLPTYSRYLLEVLETVASQNIYRFDSCFVFCLYLTYGRWASTC